MKRPASVSNKAGKRGRTADPNKAKYQVIANAVASATGFPQDVLSMLAKNTKVCLSQTKDTRHVFAETSLGMIEKVLKSIEAGLLDNLNVLETKVGESGAERAAREAKVTEAEASLSEKSGAAQASQAALDAASDASMKAAVALKEAQHQQQESDAALVLVAERKAKLEAAQAGSYTEAKEHPSTKASKAFAHTSKHFGFDDRLMKFAEATLAKPIEERSTFDVLVLRELDEAFHGALSAATETLAAGAAAKEERAAKVIGASEAAAARVTEQEAARVARDEAKAARASAHARLNGASRALMGFEPEMKRATADLEVAKKDFDKCLATIATFKELRDRTRPSPLEVQLAAAEGETASV